jgi:hypothetical protein
MAMNSTGQSGEKMRYKVILLLAVGLTAFSSAMKELNQIQQFTLDASRLIAQLSDKIAPNLTPQTLDIPRTALKLETCDSKQSVPSVELPWLNSDKRPGAVVPRPSQIIEISNVETPARRAKPTGVQIARLKKVPQIDIDPVAFEVRLPSDHDGDSDGTITFESPVSLSKTKNRRHNSFRINTRDREILLKTLNRSINLRIAS